MTWMRVPMSSLHVAFLSVSPILRLYCRHCSLLLSRPRQTRISDGVSRSLVGQPSFTDPVKLYGREAARWSLSVFSGAQPRQNAKMRDDPTEFMLRKRELEQAVPGLSQAVGSWLGAEGQNLPCALVRIPTKSFWL